MNPLWLLRITCTIVILVCLYACGGGGTDAEGRPDSVVSPEETRDMPAAERSPKECKTAPLPCL